jgi:hypothetical protein
MEVHVIWAERQWERRPITKARAIRLVLHRREFAHLRKYLPTMRYLHKQLADATEFWSPHRKLFFFWRRDREKTNAAYSAFLQARRNRNTK